MKYILTHRKIKGSILMEYDDKGRAMSFQFDCEVSNELWEFMMDNFPATEVSLKDPLFKNFKVSPMPADISFDAFWNTYGYKVGNKPRTEKLYKLLSDMERTHVMVSIKGYNSYLSAHPTQEKCYPETYLNQRRWENSF